MSTRKYRALTAADGNFQKGDEIAFGGDVYSKVHPGAYKAAPGYPISGWLNDNGRSKARRPIGTKAKRPTGTKAKRPTARAAINPLSNLAAEQLETQRLRRALSSIQEMCREALAK